MTGYKPVLQKYSCHLQKQVAFSFLLTNFVVIQENKIQSNSMTSFPVTNYQ